MGRTLRSLFIITGFTLISTLLIWLPHLLSLPNFFGLSFKEGFHTIYRNFDGLEYIIISKTFYDPSLIAGIPQPLPPSYFASHFPGYAILIGFFAPFLGYLKSMLFVSLFFTIASAFVFYLLVRDFKLSKEPLFLSLVFLILPARWLITHSVGSSEPMFIFFCISSFYFILKEKLWLAAIAGAVAQFTRPPGILLGIAVGAYAIWVAYKTKSIKKFLSFYPFIVIPLALLSVFFLYRVQYNDFFAYFHSGDNIHLTFPPFQVFNKDQFWVGDIWLEDIVYIFILGFLGGVILIKQKLYPLAFFVLTFITAGTLVAHRDVSRYLLPAAPFIIIAFEKVLTSKEFKIVLPFVMLAIYLYCQNYILANVAPVADLGPYN
jgi:Gpi18-like mannosyltransferase